MLVSTLLICIIAFGGLAVTYLIADDEPFMWRLAAGNVIGAAMFGLVAFILALGFGFSSATVIAALVVTALPIALLSGSAIRPRFVRDWERAKGKFQGVTLNRFGAFTFYAFFFILFWFFFGQVMYETNLGIFTGGSQNLGDLPFHLGAILGFTDGNNFPPQNPSFAGARFSYPFIADFLTACFMRFGADVKDAMFAQNVSWAFSLLVVLERFVAKITGEKLAGRLAPFILFFSGGLGFLWFFKDFWYQGNGLIDFLWSLPRDYTIGDRFRWGNSLVVLFITQRSLLLGMPLTILVLGYLWKVFYGSNPKVAGSDAKSSTKESQPSSFARFPVNALLVGLLAGTLPLIHLHSLAVLFVVAGFCLVLRPAQWVDWMTFGVGVCLIAVPELLWSMAGSASESSKFFDWHFGWDKGENNIFWFWIKNTGIVLPLIAGGIYFFGIRLFAKDPDVERPQNSRKEIKSERPTTRHAVAGMLFYIPFLFLFLISNTAKLAPWEWDNIKILIYWFVGSIPFIAFAIVWAWRQNALLKVAAAMLFLALIGAGSLDVWRTANGQIKTKVFDTDAVRVAEMIKQKTPPNALFLNAPTYNSAVVLSGRQSFMRYSGHLSSHGIDYGPREDEVKRIYSGSGVGDLLLKKNNIDYVLVSPEERSSLGAKDEMFKNYTLVAEAGQYRVFKVK